MAVSASHLDPALPTASRRLTSAGAGLFLLSDTVLGLRQFVEGVPGVGRVETGSGVTTSHAYAAAGTYSVTLTVTDVNGTSSKTS